MGKSLKQRFQEEGVNPVELANKIRLHGLLPVANEKGVSIEAITKYAEMELGIKDAPLVNKDYSLSNSELSQEIILSMFKLWRKIEDENTLLKQELQSLREERKHREELAKANLIEMLDAVRKI
jgi:hypothetical protein